MNFLCVPETKIAVESLLSNSGQRFANPSSGDTIPISVVIVDAIANPTSQRLWNPRAPAGGTFRAAIGKVTQAPIAGTFTVGFGSQTSGVLVVGKHYLIANYVAPDDFVDGTGAGSNATGVTFTATGTTPMTWTNGSVLIEITTALAYNASTSDLQTALNALHSISVLSPAGVVVTAVAGFYLVTFNATGGQPQLTAYATNLAPTGTIAEIGTDLQGDTGINEVQSLRFVQSPAASADLAVAAPAAEGTATTVVTGGGGANAVYQILLYTIGMDGSIENAPYDGQFSLALGGVTSGLINFDASAADVVVALSAMSNIGPGIGSPIVPNVTVSNPAPGVYIIGFQGERANTNLGAMTINADALLVVPFMSGVLALTTAPIQLLFGAASQVAVVFAITYTPAGGAPFEIFRATPTLVQPLIAPGATLPGPVILYWDAIETQAAIDASIAALTFGTMATQDANAVAITGGTIAGVSLTAPTFTTSFSLVSTDVNATFEQHTAPNDAANSVKEVCLTSAASTANLLRLWNSASDGYSAIGFSDDGDRGKMYLGHGNATSPLPIFVDRNYIEIFEDSTGSFQPDPFVFSYDGPLYSTAWATYQVYTVDDTFFDVWKRIAYVNGSEQVKAFSVNGITGDVSTVGTTTIGGSLRLHLDTGFTTGGVLFNAAAPTTSSAIMEFASNNKLAIIAGTAGEINFVNNARNFGTMSVFDNGNVVAFGTLTSTGAFTASAAATFSAAVTMSPASGVVAIAPTVLGNIQNMAIGGSTPAGAQFTQVQVGPAATPGTALKRMKFGVATLVLGTVTVGEATVTTNSRIMLTTQSLGTVAAPKAHAITARVASTSFTITSSDATDTSVIAWEILEP